MINGQTTIDLSTGIEAKREKSLRHNNLVRKRNQPEERKSDWGEKFESFREAETTLEPNAAISCGEKKGEVSRISERRRKVKRPRSPTLTSLLPGAKENQKKKGRIRKEREEKPTEGRFREELKKRTWTASEEFIKLF